MIQEIEKFDPRIEIFGADVMHRFDSITVAEVEDALSKIEDDPNVGIRILPLVEGEKTNLYAASIRNKVRPHVHMKDLELYRIAGGEGLMHLGDVTENEGGVTATWREPKKMIAGDVLEVHEGEAHCLQSTDGAEKPLTLIFACPTTHMKNTEEGGDRIFVNEPPMVSEGVKQ